MQIGLPLPYTYIFTERNLYSKLEKLEDESEGRGRGRQGGGGVRGGGGEGEGEGDEGGGEGGGMKTRARAGVSPASHDTWLPLFNQAMRAQTYYMQ
jgi:hypothetical protein